MRIAYLFAESYPNFDIDFKVLSTLKPNEFRGLDTLVRTGVWRLVSSQDKHVAIDKDMVCKRLMQLFWTGEGNITSIFDNRLVESLNSGKLIYTVQIISIERKLAQALHKRLDKYSDYLGYVQVLASYRLHHQVFSTCPYRYRIENSKVFVLYSSLNEDESFADEITTHWRESHNQLKYSTLISSLDKRDTKERYTMLDENDGVVSDIAIHKGIKTLADAWEAHIEQTLYRLQDFAPLAVEEMLAAINSLGELDHSPANAARIAIHLRRVLEVITRQYFPEGSEEPGWVQGRWRRYLEDIDSQNLNEKGKKKPAHERTQTYERIIGHEAVDLENATARLSSLYEMTHKGIHEDWDPFILRSVALRMIMLLHDLTQLKQGKTYIKLDRNFLQLNLDED